MQSFFAVSEVSERKQSEHFSQRFGCDLERIPQGVGVVGDYIVLKTSDFTKDLEWELGYPLQGRLIEFKDDKASLKWNTFYVEYEQTSNSWCTRRSSGHEKAILEGCILIISSGPLCLVYNKVSYIKLIAGAVRERTTKFRVNGNNPSSFTRARIVPVKHALECASFVYNMSEHAGFQAISL